MVGISEPRVSQIASDGILPAGASALEWLHAYCARLREQAAGRSSDGPLDLAQERAALARSQREAVDLKNAVSRGEYATISLLSEVLAAASQSVVERFEQIPGQLKRACPALDDAARDQVMTALAAARNEWVRATAELAAAKLETADDEPAAEAVEDDEPRTD
jgi:phage terminase Nu1 subunit (DNA packaging protein)